LLTHLVARWRDLFNIDFDVLHCDLTSTYFEIDASDVPEGDKRRYGYSRDKQPDCPHVLIALVVTPDGLPLAYEVLAGTIPRIVKDCVGSSIRSSNNTTAQDEFASWIAAVRRKPCYPNACQRPTAAVPGRHAERALVASRERLGGQTLAAGARRWKVKLLAVDSELYVFAESVDRVPKERAMRRRQLKWLWVETTARTRRHGDIAPGNADEIESRAVPCAPTA
jgi:hypothetical protein